MTEKRILICGDRNWENHNAIREYIFDLDKDTTIITGGCRGVDKIAEYEGKKAGLNVEVYPANWNKYNIGAGPIRNKQMLVEGRPHLVAAFHNDIINSKGTKNMVMQAEKAGVDIEYIITKY